MLSAIAPTVHTAGAASASATITATAPPFGSRAAIAATIARSRAARARIAREGVFRSGRHMRDRLLAIPSDRAREPVPELRPGLEPEQLPGLCDVESAARLAVRHRGVPGDLALEAGQLGDQRGQLTDRYLLPRPEVDWIGAVVVLGGEQQAVGGVLDVEELAGRRAVAPEHDLPRVLVHLADQVRDDVRIGRVEVV